MKKSQCPKCKAVMKELKHDKPDTKIRCICCGEVFLVKDVEWIDEFELKVKEQK